MLFVEVSREDGDAFDYSDFSGIVGLGFPGLAQGAPTLFDYMWKYKLIKEPVFAFKMGRNFEDPSDSHIVFGGYNKEEVVGDVIYH